MISAHETIKLAWQKFKSYASLKTLFLYSFIVGIIAVLAEYSLDNDIEGANYIAFFLSIPAWIFYYLASMVITHSSLSGWHFNTLREFLNPPSSIWRVFWKSTVVWIMVFLPLILGALLSGLVLGLMANNMIIQILFGTILAIVGIWYLCVYLTKALLVTAYFTMNDRAPLLSSLKFSDGYFGYLSAILGWTLLYGLGLFIITIIAFALFGLMSTFFPSETLAYFFMDGLGVIFQSFITIVMAFIYAEAYKQITENKS